MYYCCYTVMLNAQGIITKQHMLVFIIEHLIAFYFSGLINSKPL